MNSPWLINTVPESDGYIAIVDVHDPLPDGLMTKEEYHIWLESAL